MVDDDTNKKIIEGREYHLARTKKPTENQLDNSFGYYSCGCYIYCIYCIIKNFSGEIFQFIEI